MFFCYYVLLVFYIFYTEHALVVELENNAQKYTFSIKFSGTVTVNPSCAQLLPFKYRCDTVSRHSPKESI